MNAPAPKLRVLVVDDDADIRNLIRLYLKGHAECDQAHNGDSAVEKFRLYQKTPSRYQLILLDILMPGMNGRQVLEKIRAIEKVAGTERGDGVKIIMLTALDDTGNVLHTFKHGCDSYLVKPFDDADLLREIRELGLLPA